MLLLVSQFWDLRFPTHLFVIEVQYVSVSDSSHEVSNHVYTQFVTLVKISLVFLNIRSSTLPLSLLLHVHRSYFWVWTSRGPQPLAHLLSRSLRFTSAKPYKVTVCLVDGGWRNMWVYETVSNGADDSHWELLTLRYLFVTSISVGSNVNRACSGVRGRKRSVIRVNV